MINCKICGKEFDNIKSIGYHLQSHPDITAKEYYDKFIKKPEEGCCKVCGKPTSFISMQSGYKTYCGNKCAGNSKEVREKFENTCKQRLGVKYPSQNKDVIKKFKQTKKEKYGDENFVNVEKRKQTCLEKYGVESATKLDSVKEKQAKTNIEKYGAKTALITEEGKKKTIKTLNKKYGVDNVAKSPIIQEKIKQTNLEKYGVENVFQVKEFRDKGKLTKKEKYGNENYNNSEKRKQTCQEKYGGNAPICDSKIKEKIEQTMLDKYGVKSAMQSPVLKNKFETNNMNKYGSKYPISSKIVREKSKETYLKHYNSESYLGSDEHKQFMKDNKEEIQKKVYETKKKNGTFNTSKLEEDFYTQLLEVFDRNDIERQYKEERYPWRCDFYIKSLDLFIEINGTWTHGGHWFDKNNQEDIKTLNEWEEKSKNSKYCKIAVDVWTKRDIKKRETAKENNLNYVVLWDKKDIEEWFKLDCPIGQDWKKEYTWREK